MSLILLYAEKILSFCKHVPWEEAFTVISSIQKTSSPKQVKSLLICAGHSETDSGAIKNGITESSIVLEFRDLVAAQLVNSNVAFSIDGKTGSNLPLSYAISAAKKHDIAIEFHCNSYINERATGVETLSKINNFPLCYEICKIISETLGINNRGAKKESEGQHSRLGFISKGNGIIVELFFISNSKDLLQYESKKHILAKRLAKFLEKKVLDAES